MRHVIYLLLVANLVFFAWHAFQGTSQPVVAQSLPPIPATARPLVILQEREMQQVFPDAQAGDEDLSLAGLSMDAEAVDEDLSLAGLSMDAEAVDEDLSLAGLSTDAEAGDEDLSLAGLSTDAEAGDEELTVAGLSSDVQTLSDIQALSEKEAIEAVEALTKAEPPGAGIPSTCRVLGSFGLASEMKAAKDRLNKLGFSPQPRTSEVEVQTGYWIYLPAMTHEEAQEVKRTLDSKKVRDYFIGKDNFISLGIYNQKETADRRLDGIRKIGLDPILEPRYASSTVYWLDFEVQAGESLQWEQITTEFPDIRLQELACR